MLTGFIFLVIDQLRGSNAGPARVQRGSQDLRAQHLPGPVRALRRPGTRGHDLHGSRRPPAAPLLQELPPHQPAPSCGQEGGAGAGHVPCLLHRRADCSRHHGGWVRGVTSPDTGVGRKGREDTQERERPASVKQLRHPEKSLIIEGNTRLKENKFYVEMKLKWKRA